MDLPTSGEHPRHSAPIKPLASFENRRVGPYLLQSELGRGGMGSVWLAIRDDGQYEGKVAIKLLATSWLGQDAELRFRQEGTLLARLDHPNIARLLDAGVTELGEPYLVLEYVEGERVDEYCSRADLDVRARIELFIELLGAVALAHRNLIVHRDIKPANVLVNAAGKIKLLDFGISKLLEQQPDPSMTRTGHTLMTPQYAAPEQLLGEPVTTATDIYALGLLLYLLLTGRLPYSATTSPAELMRLITTGILPLPSSLATTQLRPAVGEVSAGPPRAGTTLRRQLRGDLDNIVLKAVHAAPEHRYQDVAAFEADLRRYLHHEPVSARAATSLYRFGKFVRRNRSGVGAAFLVLLSMTLGGFFSVTQWLEAKRQRDIAQVQQMNRGLISDFIDFAVQSDGGPDRAPLTMAEHLERSARSIEQRFAAEPKFAGELLVQLTESLPKLSTATIKNMLERAYALGRKTADAELMASALCTLARREVFTGDVAAATDRVQQAKALMARLEEPDDHLRIECLVAEGLVAQSHADSTRATTLLREATERLKRGGQPDRSLYGEVLSYLAWIYVENNNLPGAIEVALEGVRIDEEFGMTDTSDYVGSLENLAVLWFQVGEIGRSLADRERIGKMSRKFFAAEEMQPTMVYNNAVVLLRMDRSKDALAMLGKHVERLRKAENPAVLLKLLHAKAWVHIRLQQWSIAEDALAEAQPLLDRGLGNTALDSQMEVLRADLASARQDTTAARQHMQKALALSGYSSGNRERSVARVLMAAANMALASGQNAAAEKYARDALQISESIARGPDSSADVGESLLVLAKATAGKSAAAERAAMLQRAVRCLTHGLDAEHQLTLEARSLLAQD